MNTLYCTVQVQNVQYVASLRVLRRRGEEWGQRSRSEWAVTLRARDRPASTRTNWGQPLLLVPTLITEWNETLESGTVVHAITHNNTILHNYIYLWTSVKVCFVTFYFLSFCHYTFLHGRSFVINRSFRQTVTTMMKIVKKYQVGG